MPRGARVKTTWRKKQPKPKAKGKNMNFTIRGSEGAIKKRKGEALRSPGDVKLPHSSFRNVMGKPRDYDHPLEEILFSKNSKKDKRTPHERLVEFQQECKHSFSRVLAQKRDDQGKVIQLRSCGNCWVAKWSG